MPRLKEVNDEICKIEYGVEFPIGARKLTYRDVIENFVNSDEKTMAVHFTETKERDAVYNTFRHYRKKELGLTQDEMEIVRYGNTIYVGKVAM